MCTFSAIDTFYPPNAGCARAGHLQSYRWPCQRLWRFCLGRVHYGIDRCDHSSRERVMLL